MKIRESMGTGFCGDCRTAVKVFRDPRGGTPVCAACMDAEDLRRTHQLKCWPPYFQALGDGTKTFELRKDDRHYRVGDILWLREWEPEEGAPIDPKLGRFTGREHKVRVTYKLAAVPMAFGLVAGYVILSVVPVYAPDEESERSEPAERRGRGREASLGGKTPVNEGGACWRLGCRGVVPEGKVGCEEHRLEGDTE